MSQPSTESTTPANKGVKQGLPRTGLPKAEVSAQELWDIARHTPTAQEAFAKALGFKRASGSSWDTRIAIMRGFGLVTTEGNKIGLSPLGQQLVKEYDAEKQREARRTAIKTHKAYRELVASYRDTPLPSKSVLANRLKYEYGKKEDFALDAAQAFIDSLAHAEMLDEGSIVREAGADENTTVTALPTEEQTEGEGEREAAEIDAAEEALEKEETGQLPQQERDAGLVTDGTDVNVSLALTLDLSQYQADEVIRILQAIGVAEHD